MQTIDKLKNLKRLSACLALLLLISACAQSPSYQKPQAPQQSQQAQTLGASPMPENLPPVKVAMLLPLSGNHAHLGQSMLNAAQIALFDLGYDNFQLLPKDTGGTPTGAEKAAKEAVSQGAQLILGPLFSPSVRAAAPIAAQARINMISFSTDWTLAGGNIFVMGFLPFDQVNRIAAYTARQNIKDVGVIAADDNYGRAVSSAFISTAPRYGLHITKTKTFPPQSKNLAPDVKDFSQNQINPNTPPFEAVFMPVGGQQAGAIANLLSHNNLPPRSVKRLSTGIMDDPALTSDPNLQGAWFAAPDPKARIRFEQNYRQTYGQTPPRIATLAYDSLALTATLARQGFQQTGHPAFDRGALTNPDGFYGIDGLFRFHPDGKAERGLAILEIRGRNIVTIDEAPTSFTAPPSAR
ncbi:MAG: penicillin-binding protein activator [Alphaproteobacteria bacterium]|nr:penicillin-binding protein activator [Alphaproteobacteria bacterium]